MDHLNISSPIPWRFHMKYGFSWPIGFREDIWKHTHTHRDTHTQFLHNRTQQLRVVPDERVGAGGGAGRVLWRQSTTFLWGWRGCFFFLNPVGSWLLWKCIIFCRWWSFSKMQFVQMGSVGVKKKFLLFRRGLSRKKKTSYASAMVVVLTDKLTL